MKYLLIALLGISFQAQAQKATDGDLRPLLECAADSSFLIEQALPSLYTRVLTNGSAQIYSVIIIDKSMRYDIFSDHIAKGDPNVNPDPEPLENTDPILNMINSAFVSMESTVYSHSKVIRTDKAGVAKFVSSLRNAICTCSKYGIEVEAARAARKAVLENKEIIFQTIKKEQIKIQAEDLACSKMGA